jgi:EmrB/QacA subfamily drug resistance transporter
VTESDAKKWWTLALSLLAITIVVIDNTVLTIAIPTMMRDLDASLATIQWVISGYALTYASLLVLGGRLGDIYGERRLLIVGAALFGIGSYIASEATSVPMLVLGEAVIEGIGAALLTPATMAIVANTFTGRRRTTAFAAWGTVLSVGSTFGPLLGGYLTTYHSWRWAFRLNVVVAMTVIAGTLWLVGRADRPLKRPRLDLLGAVLISAGTFLVVFALTQGESYGWLRPLRNLEIAGTTLWPRSAAISAVTLAIALGLSMLAAFVRVETRKEREGSDPLFELSQFRFPTFRYGVTMAFAISIAQTGGMVVLPVFLQGAKHLSPVQNGLWMASIGVSAVAGAQLSGPLARRIGSTRVLRYGAIGSGSAIALEAVLLRPEVTFLQLLGPFVLHGVGAGFLMALLTKVVLQEVPARRMGAAAGINTTARQTGGALGAAVIGTVFAVVVRNEGLEFAVRPALLIGAALVFVAAAITWRLPDVDLGEQEDDEELADRFSLIEPADAHLKG